jgi:acyl carrier protein
MVELDADLEADLGIDSIKKAQLFGELAEQFEVNIESAEEMSLDDYPTLRHVMKFLEGAPQRATA